MKRREFIKRMVVASVFAVTGAAAIYEILDRASAAQQQVIPPQQIITQSTQSGSGSTTQVQAPAGYVFVTTVSALTGKTSSYFVHPSAGTSLLIDVGGSWKAFSATCTHQVCTVQYGGGSSIRCPCHGATFSAGNGSVLGGPAPRPLPEYGVQVDSSGNLFVSSAPVN